ncbi:Autophagy-related protein 18a [Durusdinium trenchii]|uniref:Autophagy-related protein 18a n=1 Tax=Durusdinium trenchii TaxID=1381693 RepID=A0ABP0I1J2_9DINO
MVSGGRLLLLYLLVPADTSRSVGHSCEGDSCEPSAMMQLFSNAMYSADESCNATGANPFRVGQGNGMNCNGYTLNGQCSCLNTEDNQVDFAGCWFGDANGSSTCPYAEGVQATTCRFEGVQFESQDRNQICFVTPPNTKILGACVKSGTPEDEGCIGGTFCYTQSCRTSTDGLQQCSDTDTCRQDVTIFCISRPTGGCGIDNYNLRMECCTAPEPEPTTTTTSGGGHGDPHIETLRGAHYTMANDGTFLAFNFSKKTKFRSAHGLQKAPITWQLFARYAGKNFLTHALLLRDHSNHTSRQALELTTETCDWHQQPGAKHRWEATQSEGSLFVPGSEAFLSGFKITELKKPAGSRPKFFSRINLLMNTEEGAKKVAELQVTCRLKRHLDYKIIMFRDADFAGGELGQIEKEEKEPEKEKKLLLLSRSNLWLKMRTDAEFQSLDDWRLLGGSREASEYLDAVEQAAKDQPEKGCTEDGEQDALKLCRKHLPETSEVFADCVFDVCHGGGEEAAEDAAEYVGSAS